MEGSEIARRLAERHGASGRRDIEIDPIRSLLNYAETPHDGDWTLRSASVRLAQRDPVRVGALLQVMRRLDAALHHAARALQAEPAWCDEAMAVEGLGADGVIGDEPDRPYPDIRTADLARLVAAGHDAADVVAGYRAVAPLQREEELAVPLLAIAARFDLLARQLAVWADGDLSDPPIEAVDRLIAMALDQLDELGVPEETGPPPRGARTRSRG